MKKRLFGFLSTLFLASAAFVACNTTDSPEEGGELILRADKTMLDTSNATDAATFTVSQNGVDVTKSAEIWQIEGAGGDTKLASNTFSTTEKGSYKFEARYTSNGNTIKSTAITVGADVFKEVFYRKIFAQQFTSTDCTYCPNMTKALNEVEATEAWKDRLVRAAFHKHYSTTAKDPMYHSSTDVYMNSFGLRGLPALLPDFISAEKHEGSSSSKAIIETFTKMLSEYPATCGVAIESKLDAASRKVEFTVKVKASWPNEYTIFPMLLEDHIIDRQNSILDYEHNHTLRATFTDALLGEKLGTINADQEVSKTYTYTLPETWNADNMNVAVCVLSKLNTSFYGNNSAVCPINGSVDYIYNK